MTPEDLDRIEAAARYAAPWAVAVAAPYGSRLTFGGPDSILWDQAEVLEDR